MEEADSHIERLGVTNALLKHVHIGNIRHIDLSSPPPPTTKTPSETDRDRYKRSLTQSDSDTVVSSIKHAILLASLAYRLYPDYRSRAYVRRLDGISSYL